jgi:drug/metabolite transporter (DMT)-like permease
MSLPLGILFGILAMISWGAADFFVAKSVRTVSVFKTFVWSQLIGLIPFILIFAIFFNFPSISFNSSILILITGLLGFVGVLAFYKGLQVGNIPIVSPIAASSAVVTVILSVIFLKEILTSFQSVGISLAILGTILTSFKFHDIIRLKIKSIASGVKFAVIAMLAWGISFALIDVLIAEFGWFFPIFFLKVLGVFYALAYSGISRKSIAFPTNIIWFLVLIGILEAAAFLSIGAGIGTDLTSIVVPIASAFPAVTIILARIYLKEILEFNQKLGVLAVLMGLVLLSI